MKKYYYENPTKYSKFHHSELWSLDYVIAHFIVPRLKVFKESKLGTPGDINTGWVMPEEEWDEILQTMIDGFEEATKIEYSDEAYSKIQKGLEMFAKYYRNLWT